MEKEIQVAKQASKHTRKHAKQSLYIAKCC